MASPTATVAAAAVLTEENSSQTQQPPVGPKRDRERDHRDSEWRNREREREEEQKKREEKARDREREKELEAIKEQYLGSKKPKKRVIKPSEKFRFSFDWENTEDTSRDMNSLYQNPHEAQLLFGRGFRAGKTGTATTFLTLGDSEVFFDLKQMLIQSNSPVPPELARHEASKFKPGTIPDRPPVLPCPSSGDLQSKLLFSFVRVTGQLHAVADPSLVGSFCSQLPSPTTTYFHPTPFAILSQLRTTTTKPSLPPMASCYC